MAAAKTGPQEAPKGKAAGKATGKPAGRSAAEASGFSADERAAMKERSQELKAEGRRRGKRDEKAEGESAALAAIAAMGPADRALGERLHALIKAAAPELWAKTWYGMPAYVKDGKTICFFQNAGKFKARYSTFGFNDSARLDDGNMWPTSFALKTLTPADEARITALVKQAVS